MIGYSAGNFGKNLFLGGIDFTLLYMLTDLLGIRPTTVGALMTLVFIGDVIFDIAAGFVVAHARERGIGYRKSVVLGAIPCGVSFAVIYALPWLGLRNLPALVALLLTFRAAYAIIDVPHNSLLASVAPDSRSRGRTSGYRTFFSSLSSLAIATLLTPAVLGAASRARIGTLALLGIGGALLACATLWTAAWTSHRDRPPRLQPRHRRPAIALFPRLDRLVMAMVAIGALTGFASPMFARMMIYLASYVYHQPDLAGRFLLALALGQFPGVVLWTWLLRFADKTRLLAISHGVTACALLAFALADGHGTVMIALAVLAGVGLAGVYMFPWGILADVIDFAEFRHGDRREAAMVALILVTAKASAAASTGMIGWVLGAVGYRAGQLQASGTLLALKVMGLGVPILGSLIAMGIVANMTIGDKAHAGAIRALERRRNRAAAA
ncbi:MAG: MFS transporter [Sphingomonadales bacterium]|nr:MFS transporter [Sphingomonadales bacterium]MDE2171045.1 MFS transporter [Sphingomonadales bacterium]